MVDVQVSVADCPAVMLAGVPERVTVGFGTEPFPEPPLPLPFAPQPLNPSISDSERAKPAHDKMLQRKAALDFNMAPRSLRVRRYSQPGELLQGQRSQISGRALEVRDLTVSFGHESPALASKDVVASRMLASAPGSKWFETRRQSLRSKVLSKRQYLVSRLLLIQPSFLGQVFLTTLSLCVSGRLHTPALRSAQKSVPAGDRSRRPMPSENQQNSSSNGRPHATRNPGPHDGTSCSAQMLLLRRSE